MSEEIYKLRKAEFLKNLTKVDKTENETRFQSSSGKWLEERRKLLTASNFARVCKRKQNSNSAKFVETWKKL